jgi:hypothetical protein
VVNSSVASDRIREGGEHRGEGSSEKLEKICWPEKSVRNGERGNLLTQSERLRRLALCIENGRVQRLYVAQTGAEDK